MPDEEIVDPSPAEETAAPAIENWSDEQHAEWLQTGKTPNTEEPAPSKETAESKDESVSEPAPDKKAQEPAPRKGAEARKAELNAEIRDLLRKRNDLRQEVTPPAKQAGITESAPKQASTKPTPPDVKTWSGTYEDLEAAKLKYAEDIAQWHAEQSVTARERAAAEAKVNEKRATLDSAWAEKRDAAIAEDGEFEKAVQAVGPFLTRSGVHELVMGSEHGVKIVDHLYRNATELAPRFLGMTTTELAREIGKLEASFFQTKPAAPAKTAAVTETPLSRRMAASAASKPATELGGRASTSGDEAEAAIKDGDFERYSEIMNRREIKKRSG